MIQGELIEKYEDNKIYIPKDYVKDNYKYTINNTNITIITNLNCYTQYQTTYCDCKTYNLEYGIISETYSCNYNPSTNLINNSLITSDINYSRNARVRFNSEYNIYFGMFIIALLLTIVLKKNSRRL